MHICLRIKHFYLKYDIESKGVDITSHQFLNVTVCNVEQHSLILKQYYHIATYLRSPFLDSRTNTVFNAECTIAQRTELSITPRTVRPQRAISSVLQLYYISRFINS